MIQVIGTHGFRLLIAALLVGTSTTSALAYLDPGTGSIILQVMLGGVAGLLLAGKLYWHRILTVLGIRREAPETHVPSVQQDVGPDASTRK